VLPATRANTNMPWNETDLHRHISAWPRPKVLFGSSMSDAAVLRRLHGRPVLCSDQVIEGVHVLTDAPPRRIGAKAALRALSDLAATAAWPVALECSLRAPAEREARWLRAVLAGVRGAALRHGAELVGGDLAAAPGPFGLTVTALGEFRGPGRPPGRERLRLGDAIVLTGPVGGSLLGRHLAIRPRLAAGRALFAGGARALMDVSDGLALDLGRLAARSGLGIVLEHVPIHAHAKRRARLSGRSALDHALSDGEDHELLAGLSPARLAALLAAGLPDCPRAVRIGRTQRAPGLWIALNGVEPRLYRGATGFVHGLSFEPERKSRDAGR
jgi:thiamine-monophosphate kinase